MFESSVILEGSKTNPDTGDSTNMFESSVILKGSKTNVVTNKLLILFESSVILEGSKTRCHPAEQKAGLRVVLF